MVKWPEDSRQGRVNLAGQASQLFIEDAHHFLVKLLDRHAAIFLVFQKPVALRPWRRGDLQQAVARLDAVQLFGAPDDHVGYV